MTAAQESATVFDIAGEPALAILHAPAAPAALGVLVVVGGPQYRVGSHRQFVLLARALAAAGVPTLRFDFRGCGDSAGEGRDFLGIGTDIAAAVDHLVARVGVQRVVIWGLCDAASAALMYAARDPRIAGLVLLNPWVHNVVTEAKVRLKSYYLGRLRSPAFWRKLLSFELDWRDSVASLVGYARRALAPRAAGQDADGEAGLDFVERMRRGWQAFDGPVLLVMSGDDFTAAEFRQLCAEAPAWQALM
ncbi:MAG: hydrolase 1, exosortase A system-associated, partial [Gammaproteobacteria bacterium]